MSHRSELAAHWTLDPAITFLNHGSFGATPRAVLEHQSELRARMEREPVAFFVREFEALWDEARADVARFVGASQRDVVFVDNASTGVNTVLRSLDLRAEDELLVTNHEYGASRNALDFVARRSGAAVRVVDVELPIASAADVVEAIVEAVDDSTRLLLVDHVTSQTGIVMPLQRIVDAMNARGIPTLVDGAHAPGMIDLDLQALGATYYTGNFHKWVCAPKGAAFLYVERAAQKKIRPLVISHGAGVPLENPADRFQAEFWWQGTRDPSAYFSVGAAIAFVSSLVDGGWDGVRRRMRELVRQGRRVVADAIGAPAICPDEMLGALAAIPIPDSTCEPPTSPLYRDPLQDALLIEHQIEVPIIGWPTWPKRLLRISAHVYNRPEDYELLAEALGATGL